MGDPRVAFVVEELVVEVAVGEEDSFEDLLVEAAAADADPELQATAAAEDVVLGVADGPAARIAQAVAQGRAGAGDRANGQANPP